MMFRLPLWKKNNFNSAGRLNTRPRKKSEKTSPKSQRFKYLFGVRSSVGYNPLFSILKALPEDPRFTIFASLEHGFHY